MTVTDRRSDGPTDRRTDGPTDGRTKPLIELLFATKNCVFLCLCSAVTSKRIKLGSCGWSQINGIEKNLFQTSYSFLKKIASIQA